MPSSSFLLLRPTPSPRAIFSQAHNQRRRIHTSIPSYHENPLGLPRSNARPAPTIPRRGPIEKRGIPFVKHVVIVASGKGGVGKSTVAVNLALSLASTRPRAKIGVLDLDVFGPSVPKLMGLEDMGEPDLTGSGALIPLTNYTIPTMSMGYLIPQSKAPSSPSPSNSPSPSSASTGSPSSANDTPIVWRGLMVQKAVQQLLFDVDWRRRTGQKAASSQGEGAAGGEGLDVLVVDMPPGTGDVQLTVGQLAKVDGAVIVSTPQDVALLDARKGVHMFRKVDIPIFGLVLNSAYYRCPSCSDKHYIFGSTDSAKRAVSELNLHGGENGLLGEIPLVSEVSRLGDEGKDLWGRMRG
ncbi:hypothetical protein M422DRAFT_73361 [Sphaerobolus stellatus SS14]|nr:hypothetical protein M422DRAFT_73361 [Sphaerobolus stellatus SS14]